VSALLGIVEAEGELPEVVRGHETDLSGRGLAFHLLSSPISVARKIIKLSGGWLLPLSGISLFRYPDL
jgi:hypothetical protein